MAFSSLGIDSHWASSQTSYNTWSKENWPWCYLVSTKPLFSAGGFSNLLMGRALFSSLWHPSQHGAVGGTTPEQSGPTYWDGGPLPSGIAFYYLVQFGGSIEEHPGAGVGGGPSYPAWAYPCGCFGINHSLIIASWSGLVPLSSCHGVCSADGCII